MYLKTLVSADYNENSKKFWIYVKSKVQEATRVAPLKNKDRFIQSNINIPNQKFKSVFTVEDTTAIPIKGGSDIPTMASIKVDWKDVHKQYLDLLERLELPEDRPNTGKTTE